jgi:hypothetical protein
MQKLLNAVRENARDLVGYGGCAAVAYGAWAIYHPAGYIVGGALLVAGAIFTPRDEA